ncbi:membrane hypothetical protein [uncultured Desulfatiglans sp.]|nr:membrane hypothetical protein [uncultured Desulfatiglans sp.]
MAAVALLEGSLGIVVLLFVAILAVLVERILQLQCFLVRWIGWMALAAFLDRVTFLPDVFAILDHMVAIVTCGAVLLGVLLMAEFYRSLLICGVFILKDDFFRDIGGRDGPYRAKHKAAKNNRQKA